LNLIDIKSKVNSKLKVVKEMQRKFKADSNLEVLSCCKFIVNFHLHTCEDVLNLLDAVEKGPNKQMDKRLLVNNLVESTGKKGYRLNMEHSILSTLHQKEYVRSKCKVVTGMPEMVYLANMFCGNRVLLEEACLVIHGNLFTLNFM